MSQLPPQQIEVRGAFGTCGAMVYSSELPTSANWATEFWDGDRYQPIPELWKQRASWRGVKYIGGDK